MVTSEMIVCCVSVALTVVTCVASASYQPSSLGSSSDIQDLDPLNFAKYEFDTPESPNDVSERYMFVCSYVCIILLLLTVVILISSFV